MELDYKVYTSIPHLPNSRVDNTDKICTAAQATICLSKVRDGFDVVIVTEKLDGSNVAVLKQDGVIIPLIRSGKEARLSSYEQYWRFSQWVYENYQRFDDLLVEGERVCGEWLMQVHSTRYNLHHEPFVVFDLRIANESTRWLEIEDRVDNSKVELPISTRINFGLSMSVEKAMESLGNYGFHGATDGIEGAVWRVERDGKLDFLAKYVRKDKVDGVYLTKNPQWNWYP